MRDQSSMLSGLLAPVPALLLAAAACTIPDSSLADDTRTQVNTGKQPAIALPLDVADEIAALESMQLALTQVADGSTYVWHRSHGRLSGLVRPTNSFKDARGQVCRHLVVVLNGVDFTKKTETVACRGRDGAWELDG